MAECPIHINCKCVVQPILYMDANGAVAMRHDARQEELIRQAKKAEFWRTKIGMPVLMRYFSSARYGEAVVDDYIRVGSIEVVARNGITGDTMFGFEPLFRDSQLGFRYTYINNVEFVKDVTEAWVEHERFMRFPKRRIVLND